MNIFKKAKNKMVEKLLDKQLKKRSSRAERNDYEDDQGEP
jgi:hypothetical protein